MVLNKIIAFIILFSLFSASCSKKEETVSGKAPVQGGGGDGEYNEDPPNGDGGNGGNNGNEGSGGDDDWNEGGGGGGGYSGTNTPTPTSTNSTYTLTPTSTPTSGGQTSTSTPTAMPTVTATITLTPTITPSVTVTVTATATHTPTATYTPITLTPTITATPTATVTPTATPTVISSTFTHTPTHTFTPTPSATVTGTYTYTPTPTATPTHHNCIKGCTKAEALNFNPQAHHDNGSCKFKACLDKSFAEYSGDALALLIQSYATTHNLSISSFVQSTCKTFETKKTHNYCCGCYKLVVSKGSACPNNCSQKFTSNPSHYWSYLSCNENRILQAFYSGDSLKFKTYQQTSPCNTTPTKGALYQYTFGVNYSVALHVKKLARPIAYAPLKLHPNDSRLKGKTYISFKNTIGLMVNGDFSIKEFIHGKGKDFTPNASCTATYEVRANYKKNNATGYMELQLPGENITSVDNNPIFVDTNFVQSPFWIKLNKQGNVVSCSYQAGTTLPQHWSINSPTQLIFGWDGQTALNAIIGPKFQAGIIINAHSLEGTEVYEYKQLNP